MEVIESELNLLKPKLCNDNNNAQRRRLHVENELLQLRLSNIALDGLQSEERFRRISDDIESVRQSVKLLYDSRRITFLDVIWEIIRLVAIWTFLIYTAKVILAASGIAVVCNEHDTNESSEPPTGSIICFSHASTMDAFLISALIPRRCYTLAKADLFMIPFFSWLLLAFDSIPIDRKNRNKAIKSIGLAAQNAVARGESVAVSPEGTRSTTGQLQEFKKGPFYMWDELRVPIVPLCIFGAYEGRVYCKFLKPILPSEANSREEMSRLCRERMLLAYRDCPDDVCAPLSPSEQLINLAAVGGIFLLVYVTVRAVLVCLTAEYSLQRLVTVWFGVSVLISVLIYVYTVHGQLLMLPSKASFKASAKNT